MRLPSALRTAFAFPRLLCWGTGLVAAALIEWSGTGELVDLQITNQLFQSIGTRFRPSPEVVMVTIDDASLQLLDKKIGRWPWPRTELARLVRACEGADAVGIDILLMEQDRLRPENDVLFAAALKQTGRVVLAGAFVDELLRGGSSSPPPVLQRSLLHPEDRDPEVPVQYLIQQLMSPLPLFGETADRLGHSNFFPSKDHILRNYPYVISTDRGGIPSFALATLMAAAEPDHFPSPARQFRTRADMERELVFYRQPFQRVSAIDLLVPSAHPPPSDWARGKMVLIGVEARGLYDVRATPMAGERSGLDIHATALSNLLKGAWLHSIPWQGRWLLAFGFGMLPALGWNQLPRRIFIFWALILAVYTVLMSLAFYWIPLRLPCAGPLLALGAAAICRLGDTVRRERTLRRRLEELQHMKKMLSNMLIHDLNSPTNSMIMLIDSVLNQQPPGSSSRHRLETALGEGSRLSNLIRTLLDIEQMESSQMRPGVDRFRWDHLIHETALRLSTQAAEKNLKIQVDLDSPTIEIQGDPAMLGRVLTNLLENALRHATMGTIIICRTQVDHPEKGWLTCQVMNHGPTISPADQNIIFEPFVQGRTIVQDQTENRYKMRQGHGLGLTFFKIAIFAHRGNLRCVSPVPEWNDGVMLEFAIPMVAGERKRHH